MGVNRGPWHPLGFEFGIFLLRKLVEKFFILVTSWENEISPLLPPPKNDFWQHLQISRITYPGKSIFDGKPEKLQMPGNGDRFEA